MWKELMTALKLYNPPQVTKATQISRALPAFQEPNAKTNNKQTSSILMSKTQTADFNIADKFTEFSCTGNTDLRKKLIPKIIQMEAVTNAVTQSGKIALITAVRKNLPEECKTLMDRDSNSINTVDHYGSTVLILAALDGHKEICEILLAKMSGKTINAANLFGNTALHFAAKGNYKEICEILLTKMSKEAIESRNIGGYSALDLANQH
jgi:ankyrin repeat protein